MLPPSVLLHPLLSSLMLLWKGRPKTDRILTCKRLVVPLALFKDWKLRFREKQLVMNTSKTCVMMCSWQCSSNTCKQLFSQICSVIEARGTLGRLVSLTIKYYCRAVNSDQMDRKGKMWFRVLSPCWGFFLILIQAKREVEENPFQLWCWRIFCVSLSRSIT